MKKARFWILLAAAIGATPAEARVVRLEVHTRVPYKDGQSFGSARPYERLEGTVRMEVDPRDPLNSVIYNLDRAPRNAKGLVEFSAPFVILKPVDLARGNAKILYGVNNRGNNLEIDAHSYPAYGTDPPIDFGDGLIFSLGFTFVDAGGAGDIVKTDKRRGASLPVAVRADGSPIVAPVRIEYSGRGFTLPLKGNALFESYETADTNTSRSVLTVRDSVNGT